MRGPGGVMVLILILSCLALRATAAGLPSDKFPEMIEARRLVEEAAVLEKQGHRNKAMQKRREALKHLERAWDRHKDPVALFRTALMLGEQLERPVAAAQAASRYLAAVHHGKIGLDTAEGQQRAVGALEFIRAGYVAIERARVEGDEERWCQQAAGAPVEGLLRFDDPSNQRYLLVREDENGNVFTSSCDAAALAVVEPVDTREGGWVLFWSGAGVAALVGGGLFGGALYLDDRNRGEVRHPPAKQSQYLDDREVASGLKIGAGTAAGVGAAMMIGGLIWALGGEDEAASDAGIRPTVAPGQVGLELRF